VPTAWLAEGLLPYLEPDAVETLLRQVSALSAPGSRLAGDFVSADLMAARNAYMVAQADRTGTPTGVLFRFGADDSAGLLAQHGWRVTAIKHPGDEDCHFGRWVGPPSMRTGFSLAFAVRPASSTMDQGAATTATGRR
jgi:methyltransferase (TIGR00027 family)